MQERDKNCRVNNGKRETPAVLGVALGAVVMLVVVVVVHIGNRNRERGKISPILDLTDEIDPAL